MHSYFPSTAMVMAAGLGTRLQPFTKLVPKAFLPVFGIPAVQYILDGLAADGIQTVIFNSHYLPSVANFQRNQLDFPKKNIQISIESQRLLGGAGGVRNAWNLLDSDSFFYTNADVIMDLSWKALWEWHCYLKKKWGIQATLVVSDRLKLKNFFSPGASKLPSSYRELLLDSQTGLVSGIGPLSQSGKFFLGAAVFEKSLFADLPLGEPAGLVETVLQPAIESKKLGFFLFSGFWYDLGGVWEWFWAHLNGIEQLELGRFATGRTRLWQERIVQMNQRVSDRSWAAKALLNSDFSLRLSSIAQPSYQGLWGSHQANSGLLAPLGPFGVYYHQPGCLPPEKMALGMGLGPWWCPLSLGIR